MLKTLFLAATAIAALITPAAVNTGPKLVWNSSASAPVGLYRIRSLARPSAGDLVLVRPPERLAAFLAERDYLPPRVPLIKRVAATGGQQVCRHGRAIMVDGRKRAIALERDRRGRGLPVWAGCRRLAEDQIFLLNADAPASLDSRYFGPLPAAAIAGRAEPLWTWKLR